MKMPAQRTVKASDMDAWKEALQSRRPVLVHLNADTTWLIQLPRPSSDSRRDRTRFNILLDPWLQGPQTDVAAWFSTQWHVEAPLVQSMDELNTTLCELEGRNPAAPAIDVVAISHEFTDHCHQATLLELPKETLIFATDKAADLVRSWSHFDTVVTMPGFPNAERSLQDTLGHVRLPPWVGIGRVVTDGNALYFHSAVLIAFNLTSSTLATSEDGTVEAIVYSPHGIKGADLSCLKASGIKTLGLLHGLDDVRIWMTAQLNLGALNGIEAVRASGAKYWIATHDEMKRQGGLISWLLRRTMYTLRDAVDAAEAKRVAEKKEDGTESSYDFVQLGSGEAMVLK